MVDMSHYEMDENLAKTATLVKYCHARGIAVEAEPGRIEGGEDGVADTVDLAGAMTTPEQVEAFVKTGIDFLAPAFGNVHGEYGAKGPQLEFDRYLPLYPPFCVGSSRRLTLRARLEQIRKEVAGRVRLVLHGTNSFPEDVMKRCIDHGVSKVNVNKLVLDDYLVHLKEMTPTASLTALMDEGVVQIQKLVEWQMDVCGSTGKA
jgi:fructose-bisphosphate aldolase class II